MTKLSAQIISIAFTAFLLSSFKHVEKITTSSFYTTSHLKAKVIQIIKQGNRTVLVLDKGSSHNIRSNTIGIIPKLDSIKLRLPKFIHLDLKLSWTQ